MNGHMSTQPDLFSSPSTPETPIAAVSTVSTYIAGDYSDSSDDDDDGIISKPFVEGFSARWFFCFMCHLVPIATISTPPGGSAGDSSGLSSSQPSDESVIHDMLSDVRHYARIARVEKFQHISCRQQEIRGI